MTIIPQRTKKEITIDHVKNFLNSMNVKIDIYGMVFAERQIKFCVLIIIRNLNKRIKCYGK